MITEILENYLEHLDKLLDKASSYLTSPQWNLLSDEKQKKAKKKYDELLQEIYNVYDMIEITKKPDYKESNYKIGFKLTFKK